MSFDEDATSNVFYLAGGGDRRRHVRTPEGSRKYGLPIGALITRDAELRAKLRFPGNSVPEDADRKGGGRSDGKIGQNAVKYPYRNPDSPKQVGNAPQTPESRRNAQELAKIVASSPEVTKPTLITPTGDKQVDIGGHTYNFPSGSRVYRSREHDDWALVRTPQYNFVLATKDGNAVDLSEETEQVLNERFDDITDEDPEFSFEIAGQTPQESAAGTPDAAAADAQDGAPADGQRGLARYERVEDVPGYQSEELIQSNLEGLRRAGLDDSSLKAVDRQLRATNDRLRTQWEADRNDAPEASTAGTGGGASEPPTASPDATSPDPNEDKDAELWKAAKGKLAPATPDAAKTTAPKKDSGNKPAADAPDGDAHATPRERLKALEDKTRTRPNGVAEGYVNGHAVSIRRNRQTDELEYSVEDEDGNNHSFDDPVELLDYTARQQAARDAVGQEPGKTDTPAPADAPERPQRGQAVTMADGRRGLVLGDTMDGQIRVHTGRRGVYFAAPEDLTVVRRGEDKQAAKLIDQYEEMNRGRVPNARQMDRLNNQIHDVIDDDSRDDVPDTADTPDSANTPEAPATPDAAGGERRRTRSNPAPRRAAKGDTADSSSPGRRAMPPRDTTGMAASQLTDDELDDLISDYEMAASRDGASFSDRSRARLDDLRSERAERSKEDKRKAADAAPQVERPQLNDYLDDRDGFGHRVSDEEEILRARPGDVFGGFGDGYMLNLWEVQPSGRLRRQGTDIEISRETFAQSLHRPQLSSADYGRVDAWSGNEHNTADAPEVSRPDAITNDPVDENSHRFTEAQLTTMGVRGGQGDFPHRVEREQILAAKAGDRFLAVHRSSGEQNLWGVGEDGRAHRLMEGAQSDLTLSTFEMLDVNHDIYAFSGNESNGNGHPDLQPGDVTTREWAEAAVPGAAAYSGDGVATSKNEDGSWSSPMGPVSEILLTPSDVENDDSVVLRTAPDADGRPLGATRQFESAEVLREAGLGDSVAFSSGEIEIHATRKSDGSWDVVLPSGMHMNIADDQTLFDSANGNSVWHVPNQSLDGAPSRRSWSAGDQLKNVDDILAQKPGTRLRYNFRRPRPDGTDHSVYTVLPDGQIQREGSPNTYPHDLIASAVRRGDVSVIDVPEGDAPEPEAPRVVENLADYAVGDKISSHRHLRDMQAGQQITLVIPASENGGRSATVVLTRTDNESDQGGFMFLVGRRGAGYNAFGENNANLFQAIFDGNLYFGDITRPDDADMPHYMEGEWSTERNIKLWDGDDAPLVSEHDLRTFIDAQVYSRAMQGSYYNVDLLPLGNPFRSAELRAKFSELAIAEYSTPGNPARHKPAMIRYAAKKLGLEYTDPGSELLADDLELSDFRERVSIGRWARRNGSPERPAEANMGPEQLEVSKADIKIALSIIDNMLVPTDSHEDPDKILKRVMAMRGSPLQSLNTSVAIASYFGMRRYRNGALTNHIARQHDKTRNKALLRQMLIEQMEGRPPGYYGLPEDETYERGGHTFVNRSTLTRPEINSDNDPARVPDVAPEAAPQASAPASPTVSANGESLDGWRPANITASERTQARGTRGRPVTRFSEQSLREIQNAPGSELRVTYNNEDDPSGPTDRTLRWEAESRSFRDINTARLFSEEEVASWATFHGYEFYVQDGSSALPDTDGNGRTADQPRMSPDMPAVAPDYDFGDSTPSDRATLNADPVTPPPSYTPPELEGTDTPSEPGRELTTEQLLLMPVGSRIRVQSTNHRRWRTAHVVRDDQGVHSLQVDSTGRVVDMSEESIQRFRDGGDVFYAITGDSGGTSVSLQEVIDAPEGTEFTFRDDRGAEVRVVVREDGQLDNVVTNGGGGPGWDRDPATLAGFGGTFYRVGDPSETNPDSGNERAPEITSQGEMSGVPAGTRIRVTDRNGISLDGVVEEDASGVRLIRVDENTSYRISDGHFSALHDTLGYRFESLPADAAPARDPRFQPGGSFRGQDIREVPVGAHIRGASGTEYEVTGSGIRGIDGYPTHSFAGVASHNAQFEYLGDSAPTTAASVGSGSGLTVGGLTVGGAVTPQSLRQVPEGHWVRWGSGGMWYRRGNLLHSESGNQVRWIHRVPGNSRFTYLGERNGTPTASPSRSPRSRTTTEFDAPSAGSWERTNPDIYTRYDRGRRVPSVNFDTTNDEHLSDYLETERGREELTSVVKQALQNAGARNIRVTVTGGESYFTIRYTTQDGSATLQRSIRGNLVENAQANSTAGYMTQTQDALFAFYLQHGIEEVEVHGLSDSGWNGGHTWIRRGFRPSMIPGHERRNFSAFESHARHLDQIIAEIESGRYPHYNEFLDDAKEMQQQMRDLIADFWQLPQSERTHRLYNVQRALTFLGEVRDGNGKVRKQPPSIGWRLMGDTAAGGTHNGGSFWYYGNADLRRYFDYQIQQTNLNGASGA